MLSRYMTVCEPVIYHQVQRMILQLYYDAQKGEYFSFPEVPQQRDGSSCGLFALAFACTLAEGKDPSRVVYHDGSTMRSHLLKCILGEETLSFHSGPSLDNPSPPLKSFFKIYCSCRLLDRGDDMILCDACKEWYHFTCVGIQAGTKVDAKWYCDDIITHLRLLILGGVCK